MSGAQSTDGKDKKRHTGKTLRSSYAAQAIAAAASSRLVWLVILLVMATTMTVVRRWWLTAILPCAFFAFFWKELIFEIFVVEHVIEAQLGTFQWYSVVDDNLLLGAIPLSEDNHLQELKKLGVKLVLSVVEPFEFQCKTLMGSPVTPAEWKAAGIDQVTLSSQDFLPPGFDVLEKGASILDRYLSEGNVVYVHCKSGRGRSASVIAAYLFKYKNLDMVTVQAKLKQRRSFVFDSNSRQMKNLVKYAEHLRPSSGNTAFSSGL